MRVWQSAVFLCLLLASYFHSGSQQQLINDVSFINRTDFFCIADTPDNVPTNLTTSELTEDEVTISWEEVQPSPNVNSAGYHVQGYEIVYWESSSTLYKRITVPVNANGFGLSKLSVFVMYSVTVRLYCLKDGGSEGDEERYGPASTPVQFNTLSAHPSGVVSFVMVETPYEGDMGMARLSWEHIDDDQWNGRRYGYYINLVDPNGTPSEIKVVYPDSESILEDLTVDGVYTVQVIPVNHAFVGMAPSNLTVFRVGEVPSDDDPSFFETPFVYIIVPGVVFVGVTMVITMVLCKTTCERRKRAVAYCRDISEKHNRIPMQAINPHPPISPSSGSTMSAPTPTATSLPRALPIRHVGSPSYPPPDGHEPSGPPFGNGLGSNQLARKQPHPGPIPQLSKDHYPPFTGHAPHGPGVGGVPMQRSYTSPSATSSVFTTAQVHHPSPTSPPSGNPRRGRARTTGGSIPSPYEVPENGNTLPRGYGGGEGGWEGLPRRPNTAHGVGHNRVQMIPPPPAHSPPPLTHSSLELFARMNEHGAGPMQNTIPRMQQRSYSTTSADHFGGRDDRRMKQNRSAGNLQILDENGEDEKVYIRPLDSSTENSVHSGARYQGRQEQRHDVGMPGAGGPMYPPDVVTYGGSNISEYSSISEMTDPSSVPMAMPRLPGHPPPLNLERGRRTGQRESVFSETSTEGSLSNSGSIRETSPPGASWERRGTSEVGVGQRRRSYSPDRRDGFSDVGVPSTTRTFKRNPV